ncbi:hypothetical protein [Zwartia vadi]|uniref:hypothetical protein n=1 Tax=Zwartia vadi TaxID=3058168 RepID=UPI0025B58231|nr:hypothetical protein [Zwartia vadi]MDN3988686.1 hypothetical protein [Zwartia vadi]
MVNGWGAFVVSNMIPKGHPDKMVDVLMNGPLSAPPVGTERVEWDHVKHQFKHVWTRGEVVHRTIFGQSNLGNGAYAIMQFAENGDMIFKLVGGPMLVPLSKMQPSK